jgi:hypothetical protein
MIGALVAGTGALFPASAQAAPTYWTFQNHRFETCLTAGQSGSAFATTCNLDSHYQQWDWVGDAGFKQLRNRATGRCLMTDNKTSVNAVWTSACDSSALGQKWWYFADTYTLQGLLGDGDDSLLRTSDTKDAVYATRGRSEADSYYNWWGF